MQPGAISKKGEGATSRGSDEERRKGEEDRSSHGARSMLSTASQARSCQSDSTASAFASLSGLSNGELFRRLTMSRGSSSLSRNSRRSYPASLPISCKSSRPDTASSTFSASDDFDDAELELWLRMKQLKRFAIGLKSVGVEHLDDVAKLTTVDLGDLGTRNVRDLSINRLVRRREVYHPESRAGDVAAREQSTPQILELEADEMSRPGTRFIPQRHGLCPRLRLPRARIAEPKQRTERTAPPLLRKDQLTYRSQEEPRSQPQGPSASSRSRRLQKLKDMKDAKVNKEIRDWAKRCERALQ
ncbi:hypothetical protein GUITHDRAFT_138057 [Guillardia theta CCMP2712]|uniref:SAM domain-containing protein n=1 Tax=Guillardia theta (strain CCMP2712) TaxID=905079 RepID=L1JEE3_GUITC|nr:hypothetical protein GUITHDRAFT_138057 [Guillardia theta CCMP2712]EKX46682.1 hypothetical protein GUITHDRAFT_138057 [Guillardia theta CCMP2712]|eukprot:XP_005833662.1 hypothetical protein GUITHDRAFT_138057 [Guillardia theta CCMP2712]